MSFKRDLPPPTPESQPSFDGLSDAARNALAGKAITENPADLLFPAVDTVVVETEIEVTRTRISGLDVPLFRIDDWWRSLPDVSIVTLKHEAVIRLGGDTDTTAAIYGKKPFTLEKYPLDELYAIDLGDTCHFPIDTSISPISDNGDQGDRA